MPPKNKTSTLAAKLKLAVVPEKEEYSSSSSEGEDAEMGEYNVRSLRGDDEEIPAESVLDGVKTKKHVRNI